jgi:hypothetical protein
MMGLHFFPDHPHVDPGDGRSQCEVCGKFVWPATHSCKGVRVASEQPGSKTFDPHDPQPRAVRLFACPRCGMPKGFACRTASQKIRKVPHMERVKVHAENWRA